MVGSTLIPIIPCVFAQFGCPLAKNDIASSLAEVDYDDHSCDACQDHLNPVDPAPEQVAVSLRRKHHSWAERTIRSPEQQSQTSSDLDPESVVLVLGQLSPPCVRTVPAKAPIEKTPIGLPLSLATQISAIVPVDKDQRLPLIEHKERRLPPTIVEPTLPDTPLRKRKTIITAMLSESARGR